MTVSDIYKMSIRQLKDLFKDKAGQFDKLKDYGSTQGVLRKLASDASTGIIGDENDIMRRSKTFGTNEKPLPQLPSIIDSLKQTIMNRLWLAIGASALLSAVCNGFVQGLSGMVEGISIVIVGLLIIVITTLADYIKDKNFVLLQGIVQEETVPTIRGKFGATSSISIWNLVVGDVIILHTGSKVPADCLVIEASDLEVKEPIRNSEDDSHTLSDPMKKSAVTPDGGDPFLYADSIISRGTCKVVVCSVGKNSSRGKKAQQMNVNEDTRL